MFRRLRHLGQAFLLVTFAALLVFLFGWREAQPSVGPSAVPHVQQGRVGEASQQEGHSTPGNMPPPLLDLFEQQREAVPLDARENDLLYRPPLDIAFIFTHARDNWSLQSQLRVAASSLLEHSSAPLRLHLITDEDGFLTATRIISDVQAATHLDARHIKLVYVSADNFIPEIESSVTVLQEFFTRHANSYYRDALFFFSLHLHRLLPGLDRVILMDIDIKVKGDAAELYSHFERFTESNVIGMTLEQSPVYRHLLSAYHRTHPNTTLGGPPTEGGFPGYNSGVVLVDINKLRQSKIIKSYMERSKLVERTSHYSFQGHLGDQDLYTLIALDHPEVFYTLPCTWNRQLCEWWRGHGYQSVFDKYFACPQELKIIHGNCKTPIPDNL
ncbi:xyloside xylosyltransferase 1-like [Eriocheir sinensis]|uniref:xyloside xylosyltransferase 1-like n=1 Tax=Eriocheir sinensis TaxID=95602 RepID=UPI0021C9A3EE|nr:xyloside xylosyltransferase 1-like [Eriocheir sinensis]XP_050710894.1 xyloside xylosyltransferase 1-like [Eriocheir sinensis]XP_050710895.1 xyloside xylosyltransferase 1-like [Eriocheir sinensis]